MTCLGVEILLLCFTLIEASPVPPLRNGDTLQDSLPQTPNQAQNKWSRQDIFTLVSVCVAIAGIFIGVLVALPRLRKSLYKPFDSRPTKCPLYSLHMLINPSPKILQFKYDAEGYGNRNSKRKLKDEC
jgi:hypothetical protein